MRRTSSIALLMGSISTLAFAAAAAAQPADNGGGTVETVVVTGSRVIANGNDMPTPVTVVDTQSLETIQPTNLFDAINELPAFQGARSQQSANISSGAAGAGAPASNQLNLRYFGANRTLVLFDGQRVAPTTITNIVDVDIVPQMLIQRVDVVTGGVSAVYGSDAVVGVVNFVPDKKFDGVKVQAQAGESRWGDNQNWKAGIAGGMTLFDGRGHIEGSFQHYSDDGIPTSLARPYQNLSGTVGTGTAPSSPLTLLKGLPAMLLSNQSSFGGLITSGVLSGQTFKTNGVLSPFIHGTSTLTSTTEIGGDGSYNDGSIVAVLRWDQAYGRFDFDFTDNIRGHIQTSYVHKFNQQHIGWMNINNYTMSSTNAFLPAAYQAQLATAKQTTFKFSERVNQAPELLGDVSSNQAIVNAGLDGNIGDYAWNVGFNYGRTALTDIFVNNPNNQNLDAALDAVVDPKTGNIVCSVTVTNPTADPGCVPLNLFGPTAASAAAIAYAFPTTRYDATTKMYDFSGSISGSPFSTWAGPVATALSAEWRRLTFSSRSNASADLVANCTGLRFNCSSTQALWVNAFGVRSPVGVSVAEGAFEVDAPLLKDQSFAKSVSFNGAVRYMTYTTSGSYWAWKAGLVWEVDDELRLRTTFSRDIRAPTLNDLFAPAAIKPTGTMDLLTGLTPTVPSYRAGNPALRAEIGNTKTLGAVYQPDWLPGASLSVDAFDIKISHAINEIKGDATASQVACYASGGTSNYCTLQLRPINYTDKSPANVVQAWYQYNINIASVRSYGVDIEANYTGTLFDHQFALRTFVTWQPHFLFVQPGVTNVDMGGAVAGLAVAATNPRIRLTATQSFNVTDDFRVDLTERARGSLRLNGDTGIYQACCTIGPVAYLDLNLSYSLRGLEVGGYTLGQSEVFFNIANLLDQKQPAGSGIGYDDPIGQAFLAGFRVRF